VCWIAPAFPSVGSRESNWRIWVARRKALGGRGAVWRGRCRLGAEIGGGESWLSMSSSARRVASTLR